MCAYVYHRLYALLFTILDTTCVRDVLPSLSRRSIISGALYAAPPRIYGKGITDTNERVGTARRLEVLEDCQLDSIRVH